MSDMSHDTKREIKELGPLMEEMNELSAKVTSISKQIEIRKASVLSSLGVGNFTIKGWICQIEEKISKGRTSTSWKSVAEGVKESYLEIESAMTEKYPEHEDVIHKVFKKLLRTYMATIDTFTTPSQDKVNTTISVIRVSE